MEPFLTNDAVILGLLLIILATIFYTHSLPGKGWKTFYKYVPALLLCYFVPALFHYPLGWIAPHWYDSGLTQALIDQGVNLPAGFADMSYDGIQEFIRKQNLDISSFSGFEHHSQLYFVASRYLLPASLILLCLSIDLKGIVRLGPKALIMFFTATLGIVIGGPIALYIVLNFFPDILNASPEEIWRGLSTVAGSWIGGGANQTAMKEIYEVGDNLFANMIVVDVIVANVWMAFLLYGAGISDKIDKSLKADNSAIYDLQKRVESYSASVAKIPNTTDVFILLAVAFGGVAIAHFGTDCITPWIRGFRETLERLNLNSLMSGFFWLIVISTTLGVGLSFTKLKKLEGVGASRWGSVFIYILVATIGMKMNLGEMGKHMGLFAVGFIWMSVHVILLLVVAKIIKAPFFFVAVGSQANVGGAASAPIVASAFNPALAPVGVLMAVLGYALGTYGAIACALFMQSVAT